MFPLEQGAFEMVLIGVFALIVVGPKDLPVLMRRVGQALAKMRGLAAEFRASFDEMARQSELDELRKEVEALRTGVSAPLTDMQSEMDALNDAYRSPPFGTPSPASSSIPAAEPQGFAFPPSPLAYEPPVFDSDVFDTPVAEEAAADAPAKPKAPRKPRAPKGGPVEVASTDPIRQPKAPRKPRAKPVTAAPEMEG